MARGARHERARWATGASNRDNKHERTSAHAPTSFCCSRILLSKASVRAALSLPSFSASSCRRLTTSASLALHRGSTAPDEGGETEVRKGTRSGQGRGAGRSLAAEAAGTSSPRHQVCGGAAPPSRCRAALVAGLRRAHARLTKGLTAANSMRTQPCNTLTQARSACPSSPATAAPPCAAPSPARR